MDVSRAVLLPHVPSSVTAARQRLCADLRARGVRGSVVEDAALIVSELLSNALRHAAPLPPPFPPETVQVSWQLVLDGGWVEISVCDGGAETLPRVAYPSAAAQGGRGLGIVQRLAAKWGTEVDDTTTTVWAVVELPSGPPPEAHGGAEPGAARRPGGGVRDGASGGRPNGRHPGGCAWPERSRA
ncbi:ATP-binding protein [Marinactinospora rubrisoli]|uniref:ATP-binding protein n=1 Tax=Marinactinospora rubrisoli TaxID=2715399 RepID=A0ABW2K9W0_9ACTN